MESYQVFRWCRGDFEGREHEFSGARHMQREKKPTRQTLRTAMMTHWCMKCPPLVRLVSIHLVADDATHSCLHRVNAACRGRAARWIKVPVVGGNGWRCQSDWPTICWVMTTRMGDHVTLMMSSPSNSGAYYSTVPGAFYFSALGAF